MTQPIQEPSTPRRLTSLGYGQSQLFRRPAPSGGCRWCTTSAYYDDLLANGTGLSVANDVWEDVVTGVNGANTRWFDEANYDPEGSWDIDFAAGTIGNGEPLAFLYAAWGYVVFDVPDGTLIGAQLNWVAGEVQSNTNTVADGLQRVTVYSERVPMPAGGIELRCYQASGGAADLQEARLHVRRFEQYQDVYTQEFATT